MNRIDKALLRIKKSNKKILSPYITAGDPNPESTVALMHALVQSGADLLEIGVPFSDPMAEGLVIQQAMERALQQNMSCEKVLDCIEQFRKQDSETPVVLMGYVNPVEIYGYQQFARRASEVGVDGTILVDLPPEESKTIQEIWHSAGLKTIYLCSPTTSDERMKLINQYGSGYLYYVSLKGVTGSNNFELQQVKEHYLYRKTQTQLPLLVGFGIKTAEMAAEVAQFADGVVVGAALISQIYEAYCKHEDYIEKGTSLIRQMRQAMDQ